MDDDALQPVSGGIADEPGNLIDAGINGAEVAPPVPSHDGDTAEETVNTDLVESQQKFKASVVEYLTIIQSGNVDVENNRMLTFCVACGSSMHTLAQCDNPAASSVAEGLEAMLLAMLEYPNNGAPGTARTEPATAESSQPAAMEVDDADSNTSSGHRPKAKARPRRARVVTPQWRLIMNDNLHVLPQDVGNRRGKFLICGVEISNEGPESEERAMEIIEDRSSHRDRKLPSEGRHTSYLPRGEYGLQMHGSTSSKWNFGPYALQWGEVLPQVLGGYQPHDLARYDAQSKAAREMGQQSNPEGPSTPSSATTELMGTGPWWPRVLRRRHTVG